MVEIEQRVFAEHHLSKRLPRGHAALGAGGEPLAIQRRLGAGFAEAGVVDGRLAGEEVVGVAVWIRAAAPGPQIGFEIALVAIVEGGADVGGLQLDVEAGLLVMACTTWPTCWPSLVV